MEAKSPSLRKNPSRETCEGIIRRILMTEVLEKGKNEHFRTAADFMKYFESLYPASDALTKQVQRAIRSLNMPKDELGYFIPNKTAEQVGLVAIDNVIASYPAWSLPMIIFFCVFILCIFLSMIV